MPRDGSDIRNGSPGRPPNGSGHPPDGPGCPRDGSDDATGASRDDKQGLVQGTVATGKRWLLAVDHAQRRHRWLALPYGVVKKFGEDRAGHLAALISYYGFFSLFPLLLAFVSVLGFVLSGHKGLQDSIVDSTLAQFPVIGDQLKSNVGSLNGSGVALAIGLLGLLWAGLGAMQATETAMNEVWDVPIKHRPNFLVSKLRGLIMLVALGLGLVVSTVIGSASTFSTGLGPLATVAGFLLSLLVTTGLFLATFKILTNRDLSWRQLLPGAVVGAVGWALLQLVGGWYMTNHVRGAEQTYGTFALVIGLLSWLYLMGQVVVLAAEVNVVVSERLWPRSLTGQDLTEADRRALERYADVEERRDDEQVDVDLEVDVAPGGDVAHRPRDRPERPAGDPRAVTGGGREASPGGRPSPR